MSDPSSQPTQPLTEGPCQPVYVHAYGLDRETWEKLFDRVADAAHALDESVSCSGGNVCALCAEEPTREELSSEVSRLRAENTAQAERLAAFLEPHKFVARNIAWFDQEGVLHVTEHMVCDECVPQFAQFNRREDIPEGPCATRRALRLDQDGRGQDA